MTVTPAVLNLTFYQNATWEFYARFCTGALNTSYDPATGLFTTERTHERLLDSPVILTKTSVGSSVAELPVGFVENEVYYIIADGLAANTFKLSATVGGAAIAPSGATLIDLLSSVPIDLTSSTVDADFATSIDSIYTGSFLHSFVDAATGYVRFYLPADTSKDVEAGVYQYDVSITDGAGERAYYMQGTINNNKTVSRNV